MGTLLRRWAHLAAAVVVGAWPALAPVVALAGGDGFPPPMLSPQTIPVPSSGASYTLVPAYNTVNVYKVTLTANTTLSISGGSVGSEQTIQVFLYQDAIAGRAPSFAGRNILWQNNAPPTFNTYAGYYDVIQFTTVDGGVTWVGVPIALTVSASSMPGVMTGVAATAGNTQNIVKANALISAPQVLSYKLYRATTPGGETLLASGIVSPSSYNDAGLTNGTTYYYQWSAVNSNGEGPKSAEVSATPSATAYGHNAVFNGSNGYIFTPYNSAFEATSNPISYRALISPASPTPATTQILVGMWNNNALPNSTAENVFDLQTSGALSGAFITKPAGTLQLNICNSSANPSFVTGIPLWVRIDITPTTGTCIFYTAPYGSNVWTKLGNTITTAFGGAIITTSNTSITEPIIGQAFGGGTQFSGALYEAQYYINGVLTYDAKPTATGSIDGSGNGWTWSTSPSNVTYN